MFVAMVIIIIPSHTIVIVKIIIIIQLHLYILNRLNMKKLFEGKKRIIFAINLFIS